MIQSLIAVFDEAGQLTSLENLQGQLGLPVYEDQELTRIKHEEMKGHNRMVIELLNRKGLDGNDEAGKPYYEMSTAVIKGEWWAQQRSRVTK